MSAAEEARRISERLSDKEAARLLHHDGFHNEPRDFDPECESCEADALWAEEEGLLREGQPEFNGAFR